jgi:hypothetical protein
MKRIKTNVIGNSLLKTLFLAILITGVAACSKKTGSSKSAAAVNSQPVETPTTPAPPPVEEKDGMQIKRDASGNFVIHLVIVNLEPVKLMKPVKEGYVVWMTNETGAPSNIGTIEGANTWTTRKDKTKFEATSAVKPSRVFITAETDLKTQTPGKQVVWSTGNF